jgi:transcriptional regulator with XRE-family HTH domain
MHNEILTKRQLIDVEESIVREKKKYERTYLGMYIRFNRRRKKLSIEELARRSKTVSAHISSIERGRIKNPNINTIYKICNALEISGDHIFKIISDDMG